MPLQRADIRVTFTRWIILCLYVLSVISMITQVNQYVSISNVIQEYYNVTAIDVTWTTLIFMVTFISLNFPVIYLIQKLGVRRTVLAGMMCAIIGTGIKIGSVHPSRFWLVILGQAFITVASTLLAPFPPKLAAVWFKDDEASTACSIGVLALPVASSFGFLIPPFLVQGSNVESGLYKMLILNFVCVLIMFVLVFFFFKNEPPTTSSDDLSKIEKESHHHSYTFSQSLFKLATNFSYIALTIALAVNLGYFYAFYNHLNDFILQHYLNTTKEIGIMGMITNLGGILGAFLTGVVLDKFNRFRETAWFLYGIHLLSCICFRFLVDAGLGVMYFVVGLHGLSLNGILTVTFQLGAKLTRPVPESTSCSLLICSGSILGIALTYLYTFLYQIVSEIWVNYAICMSLAVADIFILFIRFNSKCTENIV